jgi:hypothetical protein
MISLVAGALIVCGFFSDGREAGCAAGPAAWAATASASMDTPAGLVRTEGWESFAGVRSAESGDGFRFTAGGGWNPGPVASAIGLGYAPGEEGTADTLVASLSAGRVLTGNPIGFMEGLFGPSISVGGYLQLTSLSTGGAGLSGGGGMQFSVFPSFAVGMAARDFRIAGDGFGDGSWEYGITHVFNRDIRGHLTISGGDVSAGADLALAGGVRVSTGTDGGGWSMGAGLDAGRFTVDYGLGMTGSGVTHTLTVTFSSGEGW